MTESATTFVAVAKFVVPMWQRLRGEHRCRDTVLSSQEEPPLAAHLVSSRHLYLHHGIYVGRGRVIHYAGFAYGLRFRTGPVQEVSLQQFTRGRVTRVRRSAAVYTSQEIVRRARARLGENDYRLLTNNCWQFCQFCLSGPASSGMTHEPRQVAWSAENKSLMA